MVIFRQLDEIVGNKWKISKSCKHGKCLEAIKIPLRYFKYLEETLKLHYIVYNNKIWQGPRNLIKIQSNT